MNRRHTHRRFLVLVLALGLLILALGGWVAQGVRWPARVLAT
jgi:hypothetical protein